MKVAILAGGLGTRLSEETTIKPKPMVEIGGRPILWHIMNIYAAHGFHEFVVALGYKGHLIKEFFSNYRLQLSNVRVDLGAGSIDYQENEEHGCGITRAVIDLVDTGLNTQTGGRIKRLMPWLAPGGRFMVTYGDGVGDIDIKALLQFHESHGRLATVTAVRPPSRFGGLTFDGDRVSHFKEKPQTEAGWINGGFFVLEPGIFDFIEDDHEPWEVGGMERLAAAGELMAYKHHGFWQPMDTLREKHLLEDLWTRGSAPWKVW